MLHNPLITIFTPTYNRALTIKALYDSLIGQTNANFEWIIVDDGSQDDTVRIVNGFIAENKVKIIFKIQENSGKHIAINRGAQLARGELFFVVDSDDYLLPDALERAQYHWNDVLSLPFDERKHIIGIAANRVYPTGKIVGNEPRYNILDTDLLTYRFKHKYKGDKAELYLTDILKQNPFPQIENETFCPEALIFYRLADKGMNLRFVNENFYVCDYLVGGLTLSGIKTIQRGPIASLQSYADMVGFNKVPFLTRIKYGILYWRFSFLNKKQSIRTKINMLPSPLYTALYPFGYFYHLRD